jgi:hypothetical protein
MNRYEINEINRAIAAYLSMCTRSYRLKIANMIKYHAFCIYLAIPYMVVRVSGVKLVVSGTFPIDRCWGGERARRV